MINLIDIQNHITKRLKNRFPDYEIRVEDNLKDVKTPAFYVSVRPILTTGAMSYKNKVVNVNISYISKNRTHRENIIMSEELEDIFNLILRVKERKLYIKNLSISELDTVLTLSFTLDYNTDVSIAYDKEDDIDLGYKEGTIEKMEILEVTKGDD